MPNYTDTLTCKNHNLINLKKLIEEYTYIRTNLFFSSR